MKIGHQNGKCLLESEVMTSTNAKEKSCILGFLLFFTKFDQISWYRIQMSALRDLDLKDAVQDSTEKNMCLDTNIPQFKIPTEEAFKSHGGQAIGPRESLRNYHFILYDLDTMVGRHLLVHLPTDHNDVNVFIIWQQQRTNRRLSGFSVLDLTYY